MVAAGFSSTTDDAKLPSAIPRCGADGGRLEVKMALWKTKDMSEVRGSVMEA